MVSLNINEKIPAIQTAVMLYGDILLTVSKNDISMNRENWLKGVGT